MSRITNKTDDKRYPYKYLGIDDCMEGTPINKLGQYEDIDEELGIDLITLFKAFEDGAYALFDYGYLGSDVRYCHRVKIDGHKIELYYDESHSGHYFETSISEYGKTWALTLEELV